MKEDYYCQTCGAKTTYNPETDEGEGIVCDICWAEKEHVERLGELKKDLKTMITLLEQWELERGNDEFNDEQLFSSLLIHMASELPETMAGFTGFMLLNKEILLNAGREKEMD